MEFKGFLLREEKGYLAQRIGDILNGLSNLADGNLGNRTLLKNTESIVNRIRSVLHEDWGREDRTYLKKLQKVGVALAKAIDEKSDISDTINSSIQEIQSLSSKLALPLNDL